MASDLVEHLHFSVHRPSQEEEKFGCHCRRDRPTVARASRPERQRGRILSQHGTPASWLMT